MTVDSAIIVDSAVIDRFERRTIFLLYWSGMYMMGEVLPHISSPMHACWSSSCMWK